MVHVPRARGDRPGDDRLEWPALRQRPRPRAAERELGGTAPFELERSDFGPPPPGLGSPCCFITTASRSVAVSGHAYLVTVVSGSDDPPDEETVAQANRVLATLVLAPYEPKPTAAATGGQLARYGLGIRVPSEWEGAHLPRRARAATYPLDQGDVPGRGKIRLGLLEHGGTDAPFVTAASRCSSGRLSSSPARRSAPWCSEGTLNPASERWPRAGSSSRRSRLPPAPGWR
jgi:hypothetical protein